jgi:hypothetical protein
VKETLCLCLSRSVYPAQPQFRVPQDCDAESALPPAHGFYAISLKFSHKLDLITVGPESWSTSRQIPDLSGLGPASPDELGYMWTKLVANN